MGRTSGSWWLVWIAALLALGRPAAAAAPESGVIAVVNGDSITTDMMVEELGRIHSSQMGARHRTDFSIDRLLQRLINNILMAQESEAIGLGTDSTLERQVRDYREGLAYRALLRDITPDSIAITDDELRAGFAEHFRRFRLTFISTVDSGLSAALHDSIVGGASMAELAARHSVDKFKDQGGAAGDYALIDLPMDLQPRLREFPVGTVLQPFFLQRVWALIRIEEALPPDSAAFDSVSEGLRGFLQDQRRTAIRREFVERTRSEIAVFVDSAQVDSVIVVMQAGLPASTQVVVRVGDRRVLTAAEIRNKYIHRIAGQTDRQAHDVLYETLREQVETMLLKEAAARTSFADQPRFDVTVTALRDSLLITRYLEDVIGPTVVVPDSEVAANYRDHQEQYREPKRVKIATITHTTADSTEADYRKLVAGADFAWLARQSSTDSWREQGGTHDWMTLDQFPQPLRGQLDTLSIGTILPPTSLEEGEIIFRLLDREPGAVMPFEKVEPRIRSALVQRAQFAAIERAMQELRKTAEIEIYEGALHSLRVSGPTEPVESEAAPAESHGTTQP